MSFDFLNQPLASFFLLPWKFAVFTLFLLITRPLSFTLRKYLIVLGSLLLLIALTSVNYILLFLIFSAALYFILYQAQTWSFKKPFSYILSLLVLIFYFLCLDWQRLASPWTGDGVHQFGIAYALCRYLALILEVGKGASLPKNPLDYFVFAFFQPTFLNGPIERYEPFRERMEKPVPFEPKIIFVQLLRILGGCVKLYLSTKAFNIDWDVYFNTPQELSYAYLWWGMYLRAITFYLLVSGANDLTIACSALGGFRISENYNYPYFRRNLAEFWRTWHMTLTNFLRDYLYIPLGGNRKHVYLNYLIVFLVIAFWHVTSMAFLIWGLWHGLGLCFLKLWRDFWKKVEQKDRPGFLRALQKTVRRFPRLSYGLSMLFTFHYVALSWLPFWGGHPQGLSMILRLISGNHWYLFEW